MPHRARDNPWGDKDIKVKFKCNFGAKKGHKMTKKALAKLTDIQKDMLLTYQNYLKISSENRDNISAVAWKNKILGYAEALRDCGQITERERMAIVIYYTLK